MKSTSPVLLLMVVTLMVVSCRTTMPSMPEIADTKTVNELRALYDYEQQLLLRKDVASQEQFYPEDFVVTNPFSMFINKRQVMERIRGDIIKYSRYDRAFDAFRIYGDTAIVIGGETVVPTPDANRADAGRTIRPRFTEVWLRRNGRWEKVVRHASNVREE